MNSGQLISAQYPSDNTIQKIHKLHQLHTLLCELLITEHRGTQREMQPGL